MKSRYTTFAGGLFTGAILVVALGGVRAPGASTSAALGSTKVLAADSLQVELKSELTSAPTSRPSEW